MNQKKIATSDTQKSAPCATAGERITRTQRLGVANQVLSFDITCGSSTTWGSFGQGDNLNLSVTSSFTSLAGYSPKISVDRSGVSWQANRVTRMALVQVRYYANGAMVAVDATPRAVWPR